ncbi:MAG: S8 family serine peptidase [Lachnospiraceae bacterium]|jgi:hypothetical protein|nr:S8 family serine peptidase [Lachnospiraceae bacterium]
MEVVIIDDGVNAGYFKIKPLIHDIEIDQESMIANRKNKNELWCSHGTWCAAIISKYAPEALFTSIKVIDLEGLGKKEQLIAALRWCLDHQVGLINLSIGSTQWLDFDQLRPIVAELCRSGCVIVAAYNNQNIYTIPASMECVVGVQGAPMFSAEDYHVVEGRFECFIVAPDKHEVTNFCNKVLTSPAGNSYATPYITAMVHNIMIKNNGRVNQNDLWKILAQKNSFRTYNMPDCIDRAVVVDLAGDEMIDRFYFVVSCIYRQNNLADIVNIKENINLVILSDAADRLELWMDKLENIKQYIVGIFCCFRLTGNHSDIISRFNTIYDRIWQENYYIEKFAGECQKNRVIAMPLIYIYGERDKLIVLLLEIKQRLIQDEYSVKVIGEFKRAYLYGFEYVDDASNRQAVVHNVSERYDTDIIICGIDGPRRGWEEADLILELSEPFSSSSDIYRQIIDKFT